MNEFIFYDEIFPKEELDNYRQQILSLEWQRDDSGNVNRFIKYIREYPMPEALLSAYMHFLKPLDKDNLEKGFRERKGFSVDAKLAKYHRGDSFRWHCDDWIWSNDVPSARRVLTAITYLNDNFTGGETEFSCGKLIKPVSGKTLLFPSFWCFGHRGLPVESGEKHILVMHIWT